MASFVVRPIDGKMTLVPVEALPQAEVARSHLPTPRIAGDSMAPVQSMLDGRMYDSKSALRSTYKAAGVVEVGNDPARLRPREKPKVDRQAMKATLERATARFDRGERTN